MIKPVHNSMKQADIEKFKVSYGKLQQMINLIDDKEQEISLNDFQTHLSKLVECTTTLINDPIKNELTKLVAILKESGAKEAFFEQLNYLTEFVRSEISEEAFVPINNVFVDLYDKQEDVIGISFLNPHIDKRTGGLRTGQIATIVGGPGSLKTTYATNICYEAIKQGKNVCFLSLEETPFTLYSKLLSRVSMDLQKDFSTQDILQHNLSDKDTEILKEEVYPYLENLPGTFYILGEGDLGDFSQNSIEMKLKSIDDLIKIKSKEKQDDSNHGIDLVVVDHLQMFKYVNSKIKDEYHLMNMYVSFFRRQSTRFLGQDKEISVILLSQCNREGINYAQKHDGSYLMQHVAEASEIERASSFILSIYTDPTTQASNQTKLGTIKLRNAALFTDTLNTYANAMYYHAGEASILSVQKYDLDDIYDESLIDPNMTGAFDDMLKF